MKSEVPVPEYEDPKELWAFFGLTFYAAQVLEQGIVNLAVALRIAGNSSITPEVIDELYSSVGRKTFGQILWNVREAVPLPQRLEDDLNDALKRRNRLAHRFFVDHVRIPVIVNTYSGRT